MSTDFQVPTTGLCGGYGVKPEPMSYEPHGALSWPCEEVGDISHSKVLPAVRSFDTDQLSVGDNM